MKFKRKHLSGVLVIIIAAMIFSSCSRKTCPAYAHSDETTQVEPRG